MIDKKGNNEGERAAQEYVDTTLRTSHYTQSGDTNNRIRNTEKYCCLMSKNIKVMTVSVILLIAGGVSGGLYVYERGPSFLGIVPKSFGVESYSNLMATNLGLVESHTALEKALADAVDGMDNHAEGELEWQRRALKAERQVKMGADDKAMKQFAFALAHDSVRALERGTQTFPLEQWNEAFRGGFVDTIVGCGHTRCINWMKNHSYFEEFSDNEKELLAGTMKLPVANERVEEIESKLEVLLELAKAHKIRSTQTGQASEIKHEQ